MSTGTLEITVISAAIPPHTGFDDGPTNTYAVLKCIKEQHCTKIARDQGRLPAWNETFTFNLQEQDMSEDIILQVFCVRTEVDELLGLARIPILNMIGKEEAMSCALISPSKGETGKLKAAWKWKPDTQRSLKSTNFEGKASEVQEYPGSESYTSASFDSEVPSVGDCGPAAYPHYAHPKSRDSEAYSKLDAVSDALGKLTMDKGSSGRSTPSAPPYPEDSIGAGGDVKTQGGEYYPYSNTSAFGAYPSEHIPISEPLVYSGYPNIRASSESREEISTYSSPVYSTGPFDYSYPPPPADVVPAYPPHKPPYSSYQRSTSEFSHDKGSTYPPYSDYYSSSSLDKQSEALGYTKRGVGGDSKEKGEGHGSHSPYGQPPPAGYPQSSYPPPPSGYPPSSYPPPYGYPPEAPSSYPPPYGYPPEAAHGYPPASSLDKQGEAFAYTERGVGGDTKEKGKGHGSHSPYGQAPPAGYPPSSYPLPPPGYPPSSYPPPYSHPPEAAYGYPPAPHGYPPAPHGYPPAPYGYPPAVDHHSGPSYPPYGYPPPASGGHQVPYPVDHGHGSGYAAAGAYVGHSSSGSKTSKKHKEPKHSSSHQHGYAQPHYVVHGHHNKHKKHKSFKGLKFKKFKKFKF